jgi:translation initiation factor 1 (eIF-1/SUI1)
VVAEALKKKLNCTTSVEKLPGNNVKDKVMQLQGHAHQEIIEYLQKEYNIDKKYIDLKLK